MKKLIFIILTILSSNFILAQSIFDKISKGDSQAVRNFLSNDFTQTDLLTEKEGKIGDSTVHHTFSILEWSAVKNCFYCLGHIVEAQDRLENKINFQKELDKCVGHAVSNDNIQILSYLISHNADVNQVCVVCQDQTPIQLSMVYANYWAFFTLLNAGADPNVTNFKGMNLFHSLFVSYNDNKVHDMIPQKPRRCNAEEAAMVVIDSLIARGIDPNKPNNRGETPLMIAAASNNPVLYDYFRSKGAMIPAGNLNIVTTLNYAMQFKYVENISGRNFDMFGKILKENELILSPELVNLADYDGTTLLNNAILCDNEPAFNTIMAANPDINIRDKKGTSIYLAIGMKNKTMAHQLLNAGALVDQEQFELAKRIFKDDKDLVRQFKQAIKN